MLTPNQVIPFLTHDDPIVRSTAKNYFHNASDFGDLTAEHAWAVIDRLGETDDTLEMARWLAKLPQTDASVNRLITVLQSNAPEKFDYVYQKFAQTLELDALIRHRDALLSIPTLLPRVRAHMERRISMLEQPTEVLWDRLMAQGISLIDSEDGALTEDETSAIIEAAARGGPAVCDRAVAVLADLTIDDWRPIFAARLLGVARYAPAIDALVQSYSVDSDYLLEQITPALVRIGTPDVVRAIEAYYPGKFWFSRLYALAPLGNIKRPESETALLRWIEADLALTDAEEAGTAELDDPEAAPLVPFLLDELAALGSLAGLDRSRELIAAGPRDADLLALVEALLGLAVMHGVTLPEDYLWRKWLKRRDKQRPLAEPTMEAIYGKELRDHWRYPGQTPSPLDRSGDPPALPERSASELMPDRSVPQPIRNAEPKIGRNDPCPCGSGRKYKKCCLGK